MSAAEFGKMPEPTTLDDRLKRSARRKPWIDSEQGADYAPRKDGKSPADGFGLGGNIGFLTYDHKQSDAFTQNPVWENIQTASDFVTFAFSEDGDPDAVRDVECPKGSHITGMSYSVQFQVLLVEFENGTEVAYFQVPANVWAQLELAAKDSGTDEKGHHRLGKLFWDFVRIRGDRHGVRYPARYVVNENSGRSYGYGFSASARQRMSTDPNSFLDASGSVRNDLTKEEKKALNKLIGKHGSLDEALREYSGLANSAFKPLEFVYRRKELTPREQEAFRRNAALLAGIEGTVSYEIARGNLGNARKVAQKLKDSVEGSRLLSPSMKRRFLLLGRRESGDSEGDALIRQEKYLVQKGLWPR